MGRWAQRRVRGGGANAAAAAVIPTLLSVDCDGMGPAVLTFSAAVAVDTGVSPDTNFDINSATPNSVASTGPTTVELTFSIAPNSGQPWTLSGQPNWLVTLVTNPASGFTI